MVTYLPLAVLHTRLFLNCLDEMTDQAASLRVAGQTNSAAFVAAHLVDSRAWTARMLGVDIPAPFGGTVAYGSSMDDLEAVPTLEAAREEWRAVSAVLEARLGALTPGDLETMATQRFPIDDPTTGGALAFVLHHEAYHLGQLALLRRAAGLPAMRYRSGT